VLRAAHALRRAGGVTHGAAITLDKRLPIASGIGGGSADAAAALRLLARLWDVPPSVDLAAIAAGLGADVPACLVSQTLFGTGIGTDLRPVAFDLAGMPILLVNPLRSCPTGAVFRGWDGLDRGPLSPDGWREGRNDLQAPAIAAVPEIADVLAAMAGAPGALTCRMSGSGATCFALFADAAALRIAQARLTAARPEWWTWASMLR
jgi:4-diphosphocytidyl-2-C-methyl-D-erythritol kinase